MATSNTPQGNVQISLVGKQPGGAIQGLRVSPLADHVILLHSDDPDSEKAALEAKTMAEGLRIPSDEIELIPVDPFDMDDALDKIIEVSKRLTDCEFTVNISGGTNVMVAAALIGCFIIGGHAIYIREDKGKTKLPLAKRVQQLPVPGPGVAYTDLKVVEVKILRLLPQDGSPLDGGNIAIMEKLKIKSAQETSYYVKKLKKKGLINVNADVRENTIALTPTGRLFAAMSR
jgi:hypothetical protein